MSQDPRIGTQIGPYRIDREVGRGGMGVVYLATHVHLERPVALKLLSEHLAHDEAFRERFIRESRMAARLHHPNIIPVHDAGEQDGVLFIAMQYVEGSDLTDVIDAGPMEPHAAADILGKVASALDEAHDDGIVHRDVKPANILLGPERPGREREVYLTDFGLVREIDRRSRLTQTGVFVGTLDYAAPEMFQNTTTDGRADQYSLACVLYECLTGDVPFPRDSEGALIGAHLAEPPPRPSEARPGLPPGIDAVLARGMAKDPAQRFASCGELVDAARAAIGGAVAGTSSPTIVSTRGAGAPGEETVVAPPPPLPPSGAPSSGSGSPPPPVPMPPPPGGGGPGEGSGSAAGGRRWLIGAIAALVAVAVVVVILVVNGGSNNPGASGTTSPGGSTTSPGGSTTSPGSTSGGTSPPTSTPPTSGPPTSAPPTTGPTGSPVAPGSKPVVEASTGVGQLPFGIARDATSVWVANQGSGTVTQIDPGTHKVVATRPGMDNAFEIASGLGSVWVTDQKQTLFRLNPAGGAPTPIPVQGGAFGVTVGFGSVWVTNDQADTVSRLDENGKVLFRIPTGHLPHGLTAAAGAIWVAGDTGSVTRIDPTTNKRVATIQVPTGSAFQVTGEAGFIWVTNGITAVIQIDPESNEVVKSIQSPGGSFDVAGGFGSVWVTNANANTLSRIDVGKQKVVDAVDVGVSPRLIAIGPEGLWVVNGDSASVSLVRP